MLDQSTLVTLSAMRPVMATDPPGNAVQSSFLIGPASRPPWRRARGYPSDSWTWRGGDRWVPLPGGGGGRVLPGGHPLLAAGFGGQRLGIRARHDSEPRVRA